MVGGLAVFLTGSAAFRRVMHPGWPRSHFFGIAALALVAAAASEIDRLTVAVLVVAVLVAVGFAGSVIQARWPV